MLDELNSLISIRAYVNQTCDSSSNDKETYKYMRDLVLMLDKKIIDILKTDEFKEYVSFKDVKQVIHNVAIINNIKTGMYK